MNCNGQRKDFEIANYNPRVYLNCLVYDKPVVEAGEKRETTTNVS